MKNQFWAGLGSRAVLVKKKLGADYEQLLTVFFLCFQGQKKNKYILFFKYPSVHTKKLHNINLRKIIKKI
jgi:hypothetical protein